MTGKQYLPLMRPDGSWIERPDLFVLARMGYCDSTSEEVVSQVHDVMARANNASESLNILELDIARRHISRNVRLRVFAGQVVLELVRIAAATLKPPSVAQAILLVSFNHHRLQRTSSPENLQREVRRGFAEYRTTAHLQAAAICADPSVFEIETSGVNTLRFLARARGLEDFIDKNVAGGSFKWTPWRVPASVDPITKIQFVTLSDDERSAAGLN